jgi:2-phospho-L-lactate guanylyltransferase
MSLGGGATWALVPARSFRTAKSRLARPDRAAIARALFEHVIGVLRATPGITGILVATDDAGSGVGAGAGDADAGDDVAAAAGAGDADAGDDVAAVARRHGAEILVDLPGATLAAIIDRGLAHLAASGVAAAVVVMADLPLLEARDVAKLRADLRDADLVLAPDRTQLGTNALAVCLPASVPVRTQFGNPDSFARHLASAEVRGLSVAVLHSRGLAFDLDHAVDVDELLGLSEIPAIGVESSTLR